MSPPHALLGLWLDANIGDVEIATRLEAMALKPTAEFGNFAALDMRAGRIVKAEDAQTRKPTYRLTIDFGPEIGT
jgi:tRNA-binding EMAP/Myf-like protein